ncbi:hypothetical protein L3X38_030197 [Prunus dulcis]|uniref:Uncharacterized protein n=1 Tax=Prunus dulcis TaxID=3755 RepID=A0AAD4YTT3_PRUDU|nr:hypothetical protein L3X38_030197 [Prunus dulcis]
MSACQYQWGKWGNGKERRRISSGNLAVLSFVPLVLAQNLIWGIYSSWKYHCRQWNYCSQLPFDKDLVNHANCGTTCIFYHPLLEKLRDSVKV